jgi:hypothetical protein
MTETWTSDDDDLLRAQTGADMIMDLCEPWLPGEYKRMIAVRCLAETIMNLITEIRETEALIKEVHERNRGNLQGAVEELLKLIEDAS